MPRCFTHAEAELQCWHTAMGPTRHASWAGAPWWDEHHNLRSVATHPDGSLCSAFGPRATSPRCPRPRVQLLGSPERTRARRVVVKRPPLRTRGRRRCCAWGIMREVVEADRDRSQLVHGCVCVCVLAHVRGSIAVIKFWTIDDKGAT
jgi:hypothetical protein